MVIPITAVFFQTISTRPTLMLKLPDKLLSMPKKNQMHGEMDSLQILDQSLTILNFKIQLTMILMLLLWENNGIVSQPGKINIKRN